MVNATRKLKPKKSPGYYLITGQLFKELLAEGITFLKCLYNAILRIGYFPPSWKVAQIIMIHKPGKNSDDIKLYRPISLLSIPLKILETLLFQRITPIITNYNLISKHQFSFIQNHVTIDQVHRLVKKLHKEFDAKKYCATAFFDISQAFDKVWHDGLLFKIKQNLPAHYFILLLLSLNAISRIVTSW